MSGEAHGFVHRAELLLDEAADDRAPGGAVTVALCGHWDHEGPCRWPHNNAIDASTVPARFRTVFVAVDADVEEVRHRIETGLRSDPSWTVVVSTTGTLDDDERALSDKLGG